MTTTFAHEHTLVLVKPDGVQRGLIGDILTRFEKKGLKIIALKMVWPTRELAKEHYSQPKDDMIALGNKTIAAYAERNEKPPFDDPIEIAKNIQGKLVDYLSTGPVVAMVIDGAHAIQHVRKIRGATNPLAADVGTIVADLTIDSYFVSDAADRSIRNLVHASGSVEEAKREIKLWFKPEELYEYNLAIENILYNKKWEAHREELTGSK